MAALAESTTVADLRSDPGRRPLDVSAELVAVTLVPFVVVAAVAGLWPLWHRSPALGSVTALVVAVLVAAGVALVGDREQRAIGAGLILAGGLLELSWCNEWGGGPLPLLSLVEGHGWIFTVGWALYRYPGPRLSRRERRVFAVIAGWALTWPWLIILTSHPDWREYAADAWWPSPFADRALHGVATVVVDLSALGVLALYLGLWVVRMRSASPARRRALMPSAAAVVVAAGCAAAAPLADISWLPPYLIDLLDVVATVGVLAVPGALMLAVTRRHLARARLASLLVELSGAVTPGAAVTALRRSLADEKLTVGLWSARHQDYLDAAGRPVAVPPASDHHHLVVPLVAPSGEPLAVVAGDATVHLDPELFGAACRAFGLTLENARLLQTADRRLVDLLQARERALTAAQAERRRVEQDLHDGAQARFLALAPLIGAAQARTGDPATSVALEEIKAELRGALRELRRLAHGTDGGRLPGGSLTGAVGDLAARSPVPVLVDLPVAECPAPVATTAYLVICEALTNALKHADASQISVTGHLGGGLLTLSVHDDGRGGAPSDGRAGDRPGGDGQGLSGMLERARSLGGRLTVTSPPGEGTTVVLEVPCA